MPSLWTSPYPAAVTEVRLIAEPRRAILIAKQFQLALAAPESPGELPAFLDAREIQIHDKNQTEPNPHLELGRYLVEVWDEAALIATFSCDSFEVLEPTDPHDERPDFRRKEGPPAVEDPTTHPVGDHRLQPSGAQPEISSSTSGTWLKMALADWTDWDGAGYLVAIALGLIDPEASPFPTKAKHVFWSSHPLGETLGVLLDKLSEMGMLERRDEPDTQYRWNHGYRGSWE